MSPSPLSRYLPEIIQFQQATQGKAVYCIVLEGLKGTGAMPAVQPAPTLEGYLERCREVVGLLRRGARLLSGDVGLTRMRVTSVHIETRGSHDHVSIWVDGALSGTLVTGEGRGGELALLLGLPVDVS